ncbi:unnamed protein product [Hermetia illucens]|uniref:Uncharacterized protein n=1 Tax=Hermetia illucens TaxID=343691 RepID=A0A7R8UEX0_HERIL|nr:unnamed protein product [Hermetia illucens]
MKKIASKSCLYISYEYSTLNGNNSATFYRLPNGDLNITAFNRLAAIVKAYANHMADVKLPLSEAGEYEDILRYLQKTTFLSDSDLMLASFECEDSTQAEKLMYDC